MKPRFDTFDIICSLLELQKIVGMRLNQVYDIDNKTYLFRFQRGEEKCVLLMESGTRFHITQFEWPKNDSPSGFSMKLRKHLRNKRLEAVHQLGIDRIVSFQFGTGEAAYYVILELYDRGNILLADKDHTILNILRYHVQGEDARFAVREKYPLNLAKQRSEVPSEEKLREILGQKDGENLKKVLNPHFEYGPTVLEHVLLQVNLAANMKVGKAFIVDQHLPQLIEAFSLAEKLIDEAKKEPAKGYITQKKENRASGEGPLYTYQAFHPSVGQEKVVSQQHAGQDVRWFDNFNSAVDEYFSALETQKIDLKAVQQEREALRKLQNVQRDHDERVNALEKVQLDDKLRGELISRNQAMVDAAILCIRRCIAAQLSWDDIGNYIKEATSQNDPIALLIKDLKLNINHITLLLSDPYADEEEDENNLKPMLVDVDLDLSAFANAKKYFDAKRSAAKKQQKTIESVGKALKSAEKKTKQALKEVQTTTNIIKARKVFWFEKFFWFISSENYLVVAGRDQIQNEIIVKRYLRENDIYVHADISGASSVVIKNPTSDPIPPKTLNEAGVMAVCYSVAWDAKVLTGAYWVHSNQVSKTAPAGEYLTTGSFMIRGKKNYLLPAQLAMGFSFLFKLEESSVPRHKDERRVRQNEDLEIIKEEEKEVEMELELSDTEPANEHDEDKKSELPEFPDTEVQIQHTGLNKVSVKLKNASVITKEESDDESSGDEENSEEDEQVVYLGDNEPVVLKSSNKKSGSGSQPQLKDKQQQKNKEEEEKEKDTKPAQQMKRGQRSKLKKIKEKYKDQDEEERKLKMLILQSAGTKKETKKDKKKNKDGKINRNKMDGEAKPKPIPKVMVRKDGEDEEEEIVVNDDVNMLSSLTGQPLPEDELLFAIPVIAPYAAVSNYKYKVKLTPGTGKRGKAASTALALFLRDKLGTPREKECLKSVKSQDLAKNIPGKVKVSAPNIHKHR